MTKKFFPFFLIFLLAIIILVSNFKKKQTTKPEDVLPRPTISSQKPFAKQEKIFLQISEPKNNITVAGQAITIAGKTIPNGFVFVNDQEFNADANGKFSTTVILDEGENYILVVVSDEYGNSIEKDIIVNLESTQ